MNHLSAFETGRYSILLGFWDVVLFVLLRGMTIRVIIAIESVGEAFSMGTVTKPEGKYLKLLCRALHIDPECRDDLPEAIQTAMTKVLSADEIELMEDKYLRRMTTSELSYKHDAVQSLIDLKAREVREKIINELNKK